MKKFLAVFLAGIVIAGVLFFNAQNENIMQAEQPSRNHEKISSMLSATTDENADRTEDIENISVDIMAANALY